MSLMRDLPFPRGQTASWGLSAAPPAGVPGGEISILPATYGDYQNSYAVNQSVAGATYNNGSCFRPDLAGYVTDPVPNGVLTQYSSDTAVIPPIHGLTLRCVQNGGPAFQVSRRCVVFSTLPYQFGIVAGSGTTYAIPSSGTAGVVAKPIDYAYPLGTVINPFDWFWVIEEGLAIVMCSANVTAGGAIGSAVAVDANGGVAPAAATDYPLGVCTVGATYSGGAHPLYGNSHGVALGTDPLYKSPWTITSGASANNLCMIWVRPGIYQVEA